MIARLTCIPLAIGLMICPTVAWEISVPEFARDTVRLRGLPLPWNGDSPSGSGPPTDLFILPAVFDLAVYLFLCHALWKRLLPRLHAAPAAARVPAIAFVWLFAACGVWFLMTPFFGFGGTAMLWYDTRFYESLVGVRLSFGL